MKTKLIRTTLLGISALSALLLASCQATSAAPRSAVTCSKCHTVHFMSPSMTGTGPKGLVTLRHSDSMSCPDCENKVVAMLKTGSLTQHTCKTCGGTLRHCASH